MAFFEGKFARALELTQSNLDLYDEEAHRDHALIFAGHDPGVCASCFNSLALLMVGNPDQALTGAESITGAGAQASASADPGSCPEIHRRPLSPRPEP